jgi:hypothetical protein
MKIDITIEAPDYTPLSQLIGDVVLRFLEERKAYLDREFAKRIRKQNKNPGPRAKSTVTKKHSSQWMNDLRPSDFKNRKRK